MCPYGLLVHQHDKGADLSLYSEPRMLGDCAQVTPQFHFGALLDKTRETDRMVAFSARRFVLRAPW